MKSRSRRRTHLVAPVAGRLVVGGEGRELLSTDGDGELRDQSGKNGGGFAAASRAEPEHLVAEPADRAVPGAPGMD